MLNADEVKQWLKEAGKLARECFRKVTPSIKENKTYVTEADIRVQEFLKGKFERRYPQWGIVAEEEHLIKKPEEGERYFVLDPIDGTASFVSGLPVWGIALGVIEHKKPIAGYFYMPATDDFYFSDTTGGVYRNNTETQLKPSEKIHRESLLLGTSRIHKEFIVNPMYPGKVRILGSTVAHLCFVATGSADAALVGEANIWDIAAGIAMLYRNGGIAKYLNGNEFFVSDELLAGRKLSGPLLIGRAENIQYFMENIQQRRLAPDRSS